MRLLAVFRPLPAHALLGSLLLPLATLGQAQPAPLAQPAAPRVLTIVAPCAVFYSPGDAWLRQHRAADDAGPDEAVMDNLYYSAQAHHYLRRRHIKTLDTSADKLRFVLASGMVRVVDLRRSAAGWGLLLFNGRTAPREADLVEPAAAVKAVFGK